VVAGGLANAHHDSGEVQGPFFEGLEQRRDSATMSQKPIEMILIRQLASSLSMPMLIVGPDGTLVFYNEPIEYYLGRRFEETGELPADVWRTIWMPSDENGVPIPLEEQPITVAFRDQRPVHRRLWTHKLDDHISWLAEVTCFPLMGQGKRHLGAAVIAWPIEERRG
jgi:PAS domain-containing protein